MFVLGGIRKASLIFVGDTSSSADSTPLGKALSLIANARLSCMKVPGTNALAYFAPPSVTMIL